MRSPPRLMLPLGALLLSGCVFAGGDFPSLKPRPAEKVRIISAPGEGILIALSDEERAALSADIDRESEALETVRRDMAAAQRELDSAIAGARNAAPGTDAWSAAQMALSRFDLARSPLGDIDARLISLLRIVDSLPADHPDRQAVESLASAVARAGADGEAAMQAGNRALGG